MRGVLGGLGRRSCCMCRGVSVYLRTGALLLIALAAAAPGCAAKDVAGDATTAPDALSEKSIPGCLGQGEALSLFQNLPFTDVTVGGATGPFLVDFATTNSAIDVLAFPAPGLMAARCPLGASCSFDDFTFFGGWGTVSLVSEELDYPGASLHQAGILGTDFLAANVFALDYTRKQIHRTGSGACDDATLTNAGLRALSTTGFYGSSSTARKPMSDVLAGASGSVPNVPTVPVRVAGVTAVAQLDTGFADVQIPHSVNINVAFFDAIRAASPDALVRDTASDLSLTTCAGVAESVEAWRLAPGTSFELVDESGAAARAEPAAVLFVKHTPAAALRCGGIGTWTAPAAQVATSFYVDAGLLVFDPFASRVWISARP
jgi:hypothetical protein